MNVQEAPSGAKLDAWIDFDGNGVFDPGEQIADSLDVAEGDNVILFDVPDSALRGQTYARFRLSTAGNLEPVGEVGDGEVEDYLIHILSGPADFGDAPDRYGTTLAADGPYHEATGPRLGSNRDTETDGLPSTDANADDTNGSADEDGVTFDVTIAAGQFDATVAVNVQNAPSGAKLDAWIDFDQNGAFDEYEQIADGLQMSEGDNLVEFYVPDWAVAGEAYARYRLSTAGGLLPTGVAGDGEVEDYVITILVSLTDFGDAPDSYGTTFANDGARHEASGPTLGASRDAEPDGLPSIGANGDDTTGSADEDGVTFTSTTFVAAATINVQNAPDGAKLDAWIDSNGDGVFNGPKELIADSLDVVEGDNLLSYLIPAGTIPGETYARFRLSTAGGLAPTGSAADGEVEDYLVTIIPPDTPYYQLSETVGYEVLAAAGLSAEIDGDFSIVKSADLVSIHRRDGNAWTEMQQLLPPSSGDSTGFGTYIGISGDLAIVASRSSVYIYQLYDAEWQFQDKWDLPSNSAGNYFRIADVAVDGDTIAVSAYDMNYDIWREKLGYVYLIEETSGNWDIVETLEHFGANSIDFNEGTLGIACHGYYVEEAVSSPMISYWTGGYVAAYRRTSGGEVFLAEVSDDYVFDEDGWFWHGSDDGLGSDVVVCGNRVLGVADNYILDIAWDGGWDEVGRISRDGIFSLALDADVLVSAKDQDRGVSIVSPSGRPLHSD